MRQESSPPEKIWLAIIFYHPGKLYESGRELSKTTKRFRDNLYCLIEVIWRYPM